MKRLHDSCALFILASLTVAAVPLGARPAAGNHGTYRSVKIGNYYVPSPYGIAIIVDDATAFVIDPAWDAEGKSRYRENDPALAAPGTTAPDLSYSQSKFRYHGAEIRFTWGRSGPAGVVGTIETNRKVALPLRMPGSTWPQFHAVYTATEDGVRGYGIEPKGKFIPFVFRAKPAPAYVNANITFHAEIVLALDPSMPTRFVAGVGEAPALDSVAATLAAAEKRYATSRMTAQGDWSDFLGAMTDNLNNIRLYGSDNKRIVHGIGRGWWMGINPDLFPLFVWDSFFDGMMASLEDPASGRETVRVELSFQTPDGRVPSFAHWFGEGGVYDTVHRSMPPVGTLCVWKMQERHPDRAFLAEVYPHLVRWHDWWMKARDGNHNGLLEWGSEQHWWQGAQYETGWDDNVTYIGTMLDGITMNADAVDLSSLWSMDAEYLARIAAALGKPADAKRFQTEHNEMNRRINERLWNEDLGIYCSRFWKVPESESSASDPASIFKSGFDIHFFSDSGMVHEAAARHEAKLDFNWGEKSPVEGVPATGWSARVTAVFTAPDSGTYRFKIGGSRDIRFSFADKPVSHWMYDSEDRHVADLKVEDGKTYPIVLEYFANPGRRAGLHLTVHRLEPGKPGSDWLTRLTPMNFYPLMAGAADKERAEKTLAWMYRPDKFWLPALLPTVAKDDPVWHEQSYWHGHIWAPANYLVWLGVKRYADGEHQAEYARRCVKLFMQNWTRSRVACENYNSTDGTCGDEPHYTWSNLLNFIGLEALADVSKDFTPRPRQDSAITENLVLRHVPFGGKLYRIEARGGKVTATEEGTK